MLVADTQQHDAASRPLQRAVQRQPTSTDIAEFLQTEFPQTECTIQSVGALCAAVRYPVGEAELRPVGTVSGPVLRTVADVALYVAILGEAGIVTVVVSTSLTINFMRKSTVTEDIIAVCKLTKVGKSLAVGDVSLYSDGVAEPVAHALGTDTISPRSTWPKSDGSPPVAFRFPDARKKPSAALVAGDA